MDNFDIKNIDFDTPQLRKIEDDDYFSIGSVDFFNHKDLVLSASTLKSIFKSDAYEVLIKQNRQEISEELQYMFDVGSAFHAFCLENKEFYKRYYVAEIKNSFEEKKTFIKEEDFEFIQGAFNSIKLKYPYILEPSEWNEITILTKISGVPFRAKFDKIIDTQDEIIIIDLKSVFYDFYSKKFKRDVNGIRWGILKELQSLDYDIQAVAYIKAIQTYLDYNGINKNVVFKILLASKETKQVKMVTLGSETLEYGEKKFDLIYPELQAFYHHGSVQINQEEVI